MLAGHLYVEPAPWEHVVVNGHAYILHPPLSAFICLPFVALGINDQQAISWLLGAVSIYLCWRVTGSGWLTAFFALGTTFCWEAFLGASWNFALVASVPFSFLALSEESPGLCGLFAGLAALARYDLVLSFPVYLYLKRDWRVLYGLGLWLLIYCWFNEARFGTLTDISLALWYRVDDYRFQAPYGPFSIHYLPFALYTLLFMAPSFVKQFPWFRPGAMGQSLLSLSPGLTLGLRANPWTLAALLCSIPALTVYASGFSQLGCRYYTQVLPFLLLSMSKQKLSTWDKGLLIASMISSSYFMLVAGVWGLS